jgi:phytoene synthase
MEQLPGLGPRHPLVCALNFAPAEQSAMLANIWRLTHQLDSLADIGEPQVAAVKLPWWHEELGRWARGEPRHPITRALRAMASRPAVVAAVRALLTANALRQTSPRCGEAREFWARCEQHALGMNVVGACLEADPELAGAYQRLGSGALAIERLMAAPGEARAGQINLPLEWVAAAGLDTRSLAQPMDHPGFAALRECLTRGAAERIRTGGHRIGTAGAPAQHRYALVAGALYDASARRLGTSSTSLEWPNPWQQLWIAWNAARRAR